MKITRLSSTEVANACCLPIEKRRAHLLSIETPQVFWGYSPVVNALPKLLMAESGLFGHLPMGNEKALLSQIAKSCKSGDRQKHACVAVAKSILSWTKLCQVQGRIISPEPLRMSVDTLKYCADVAVVKDGKLFVVNLDPRSSMTLSQGGKEFIKSLIHHTALIGNLKQAQAALLRTPRGHKGVRNAVFEPLTGEPRYSLEEILKRVNETYSIWETILRSRSDSGEALEG